MSFLTLIIKNLMRRRSRSFLTMLGIAIGIGAVVALTSLAWEFERSWENVYLARGADLIITKTTSHSTMPSPFPAKILSEVAALPHIRDTAGVLSDLFSVEDSPSVFVLGWEPGSYLWNHLKLDQGQWPDAQSRNVAVLGSIAAEMLGKKVGDKIQIETGEYTVCGIFSSQAIAESGAIILPMAEIQALTDRAGMINFINARLDPGASPQEIEQLRTRIKTEFKGLSAFSPGAVAQSNAGIQIAKAMSLATSLIALVVGAVGVMNTILMSVFERLQEIGVLLAIGWQRMRILLMILCESLLLSFAGGVAGCLLGAAGVKALQLSPYIHGKLGGDVHAPTFLIAMAVALALGAIGGIYPAWLGSRLSPVTALRYE